MSAGVYTYDVLSGVEVPLDTDEVRFATPEGDVLVVRLEGSTLRVINYGERRLGGLAIKPNSSNVVLIEVAK